MNFVEFLENVEQMKTELEEKGLDPKKVRVGYTRATGDNIIVAMSGDYTVASYIKWWILMNCHKDCEYYVEQNDMCLLYFELGFHNVSQYPECLTKEIYND